MADRPLDADVGSGASSTAETRARSGSAVVERARAIAVRAAPYAGLVAIYLIAIGLIGLLGTGNIHLR